MLLALFLLAFAADQAPLGWADLPAATAQAWSSGPGRAHDALHEGILDARRHEPLTQPWLSVQVSPNPIPGTKLIDDNTMAMLGFTVGDRRGARLALWSARDAALLAEADAHRLAHADAVRDAWIAVWHPTAFAQHLVEHADALAARLSGLAPHEGVVARQSLDDLAVEITRLRAEAADYAQQAEAARVPLMTLLGRDVTVEAGSLPDLEAHLVDAANPWWRALEHVDALPALRALDAQAAEQRAAARAERTAHPPTVSVGALWRNDPSGDGGVPGPVVAVQVPLANPQAADARAAEGAARATAAERDWLAAQLRAALTGEAQALDAATRRHATLLETVERPLRERLARLEDVFLKGATTVEAVLLAGRDVHEAFHTRAHATADVLARRARGEALLASLQPPRTP